MSLAEQLKEKQNVSRENILSDTYKVMTDTTKALIEADIAAKAPKFGKKLLEFILPNQNNQDRNASERLKKGPIIITFYRGGLCLYCNIELHAYQEILDEINSTEATISGYYT